MTGIGFGSGSKDRLGQLRSELQTGGQFDSANALRSLIFLPTGTSEITAHDALDRERFRFLDDHRATDQLLAKWTQLLWKVIKVRRDKVIVDLAEAIEPKSGE